MIAAPFSGCGDQAVVIGVGANPEPQDAVVNADAQSAVVDARAHGPIATDLLEMQGRVPMVLLEEVEVLVGSAARRQRESLVGRPERGRGMMLHSGLDLPAACSRKAALASASRRPAATSAESWASQASASKVANHWRKLDNSAGFSEATSCSSFSSLLIGE